MKKKILLIVYFGCVVILSFNSCTSPKPSAGDPETNVIDASKDKKSEPADYVNPFLGTQFFGHTFPGASLPYALVHVSPDCNNTGWTYAAGYTWSDNTIMGFSHTHFSGVGMTSGGEILFRP